MRKPVDIDELHCLTHPGFGILSKGGVNDSYRALFDRYEKMASAMSPRDAMIALLWTSPSEKTPHEKYVYDRIVALKEILSQRMTVISNGVSLFIAKSIENNLLRARAVLLNRGYNVHAETVCITYGETFMSCVPRFANHVKTVYELEIPPMIHANATNASLKRDGRINPRYRAAAKENSQPYLPDAFVDWSGMR